MAPRSYLDEGHTILSWLFSPDHKRIAILYALSITVFFFIGGFAIGLVRLKLLSRAAGSWRPTSHGVGLLLLLFGLNVGPAYVPLGVGNVTLKLFIAAVMAIVVAVFLMDLRSSTTLIRIVAITVCSGPS